MKIDSLKQYLFDHKLTILSVGVVLVICYFLYWFRLGSILPGMSANEVTAHASQINLSSIWHNPINAPFHLIQYVFGRISSDSIMWGRAASSLLASTAIFMFFFIVKRWHGKQIAILSTALFGSCSWLLHVGRLDSDAVVLLLLPLVLFWMTNRIKHSQTSRDSLVILFGLILAALLFTPASVFFVTIALIASRRYIANYLGRASRWAVCVAASLPILALGLMIARIIVQPSLLLPWLALPSSLPAPADLLINWGHTITYLFVRGPAAPEYWLGHLPILDVFVAVCVIIAAIFYARSAANHRWRVTIFSCFVVLISLLLALGDDLFISSIMPIAYLMAATGLAYLLSKWYRVFPLNNLARYAGFALITLAVMTAITYQTTSYFLAWRHNPAVVEMFSHRL